jgi:RNA methyltransferase, TrmH family
MVGVKLARLKLACVKIACVRFVCVNNEMYHTTCSGNQLVKQEAKITRTGSQGGRLRPIAGRHNPRLKELRSAFRRAELTPHGEYAIEGVKLLEEALRSGQHPEIVFFSESARPLAEKLLPQINGRTEAVVLPNALFNSIVPSEAPQGVAALIKPRVFSCAQLLDRASKGPLVVASGLQDPGNLGTILRSAEAFGAVGVFLTEGTVSLYNWKVLRASAGSIFRLPILQISCAELLAMLRARGVRRLATSSHQGSSHLDSSHQGIPLPKVSWTLPLAIFIGNEGAGLSRELMREMDETVAIPQSAQVESLNAGVAASIVLYEAARNRE